MSWTLPAGYSKGLAYWFTRRAYKYDDHTAYLLAKDLAFRIPEDKLCEYDAFYVTAFVKENCVENIDDKYVIVDKLYLVVCLAR